MSALLDLQITFASLVPHLIDWAFANGYTVTLGEAWRSPAEAAINAQTGAGIANSLHTERLAIDLNLFKDGVLLESVDDYRPMGQFWLTLHTLARWGGNFSRPDSDHFSLTFNGVS
jgi:D-alanyl-D-alanine carboxypeptidase